MKDSIKDFFKRFSFFAVFYLSSIILFIFLYVRSQDADIKSFSKLEEFLNNKNKVKIISNDLVKIKNLHIKFITHKDRSSQKEFQDFTKKIKKQIQELIKTSINTKLLSQYKKLENRVIRYEKSVNSTYSIQEKMGLGSQKGILQKMFQSRRTIKKELNKVKSYQIKNQFLKLWLLENDYERTLNMKLVQSHINEGKSLKRTIRKLIKNQKRTSRLLPLFDNHHSLFKNFYKDTLERELILAENNLLYDRLPAAMEELSQLMEQYQKQHISDLKKQRYDSYKTLITVFIVIIVLTLLFLYFQFTEHKSVLRRAYDLHQNMVDFSNGNYDESKDQFHREKDEIGLVANGFVKMSKQINEQIETISTERARAEKSAEEAKKSKIFVDNILQSLNEMLFVIDETGSIQMANSIATNILGHSDFTTFKISDILEQENGETVDFKALKNIIEVGGSVKETQMLCKKNDQESIPVLVTGSFVKGSSGLESNILLSCQNAKDSKLLRELKDKQNQVIQAAKLSSIGEMSAGIAHEINNPLFITSGFIQRVISKFKKQETVHYDEVKSSLDFAVDGCKRIQTIVKHMLQLVRESDQVMVSLSFNEIINSALTFLSEQLKLKSIKVEKELEEQDAQVVADRVKLEQVFINLINNARDAIEERHGLKGGTITVKTRLEDSFLICEIADNGIGMDEKTKAKVFDAFFTTKKSGKGTGLGGSITYEIIKEHKGIIKCQSEPNVGTTFSIYLPYQKSED